MSELARRGIFCQASFMPSWVKRVGADPRAGVTEMQERAELGERLALEERRAIEARGHHIYQVTQALNEHFGQASYQPAEAGGSRPPPGWGDWSWPEATVVIATALGAPEPPWDESTVSWWFNKDHGLFDWVQSPADVARIPTPDWPKTPQVQKMLESQAHWRGAFPGDPANFDMLYPLPIPGGRWVRAGAYLSFIDTGICLLGIANFMTVLAADQPLAEALADKCHELVITYCDFLFSLAGGPFEGWMGFGGDVSTMLSPRLYERYGNGWDARIGGYVRATHQAPEDAPWNLHSCGPSAHLYPVWSRHPYRHSIACMQTRLIPGAVGKLRQALPNAILQLTAHPGHFDFASASAQTVRRVIRQTVEDADSRDVAVHIFAVAHTEADIPPLEANVQVCYESMEEIERCSQSYR